MSIHSSHPFPTDDDPVRRFRGRLGGAVALATSGSSSSDRAGLTLTSLMVAAGSPARLLLLVDPDSDLFSVASSTGRALVQLLGWQHRHLADAFAGTAPAPGGPFTTGSFSDSGWGPRLADATGWCAVSLEDSRSVGWSALLTCAIDDVTLGEDEDPLFHRRGRWQR